MFGAKSGRAKALLALPLAPALLYGTPSLDMALSTSDARDVAICNDMIECDITLRTGTIVLQDSHQNMNSRELQSVSE